MILNTKLVTHLDGDAVDPIPIDAEVEAIDAYEPVGGGHYAGHQRHLK